VAIISGTRKAQLQAMVDAGWIMTGSWPIDTEMGSRLRAQDSAALAPSIHLVCRPRPEGEHSSGDWREVLAELPVRIHQWLPRLAEEGVVGADAIFACLGPALEVFSRFTRVEKASGEQVTLKEYLLYVWAAVSREALGMIFSGADSAGFEEDARLTAMWLWTLATGTGGSDPDDDESDEDADDDASRKAKRASGYSLEYDAARKIAQGLGAHLEKLGGLVEIAGETAKLLAVSERARVLFSKDQGTAPKTKRSKDQPSLFDEMVDSEPGAGWGEKAVQKPGETTLDRLHQSMILFAAGRAEALKRFLVEDGIGKDQRFWTLAQALSALYPAGSDEKRWVDGVMSRKKGVGL
jgi:putative DNA methylase